MSVFAGQLQFVKVTRGMLSGKAGEKAHEDFKVNGQYQNEPDKGIVGIPYVDAYIEKAALDDIDDAEYAALIATLLKMLKNIRKHDI